MNGYIPEGNRKNGLIIIISMQRFEISNPRIEHVSIIWRSNLIYITATIFSLYLDVWNQNATDSWFQCQEAYFILLLYTLIWPYISNYGYGKRFPKKLRNFPITASSAKASVLFTTNIKRHTKVTKIFFQRDFERFFSWSEQNQLHLLDRPLPFRLKVTILNITLGNFVVIIISSPQICP